MKRAIALFLALVFVFGLIPVSALAARELTLIVTGGDGGGTYDTGATVSIKATVPAGKTFTGWEVTPTSAASALDVIPNAAEFDATVVATTATSLTLEAQFTPIDYDITFGTNGIAVAKNNLGPGDSGWTEAPPKANVDDVIYVRVAADITKTDRKVSGIAVTTASGGDVTATLVAGQDENGLSTYKFTMPPENVTVSAKYTYKVSLYGATGSLDGISGGQKSIFAAPGKSMQIILDQDANGRTVSSWTFAPTLPTENMDASKKVTISNRTSPDIEKGIAEFTMPSEPLAITVKYDRELESNSLTVVNGTMTYKNDSGEDVTGTTGTIEERKAVTVTAVKPESIPTGYKFKTWQVEGDADFVTYINTLDLTQSTLSVVMPRAGGTLTAKFVGEYDLTTDSSVAKVNGNPAYANTTVTCEYDETITIVAAVPDGAKFDSWSYTKEGVSTPANVDESTAGTTIFTMPASGTESGGSLTVKAKFQYKLTLKDGTASGRTPIVAGTRTLTYWVAPGETVTIISSIPTAANPDKVFDKWTGTTTDVALLASATSGTTTFTMPSAAVELIATEADAETATILTSANAGLVGSVGITGHTATSISAKGAEGVSMTATAPVTVSYASKTWAFTGWETMPASLTTNGGATPITDADKKKNTLVFDMAAGGVTLKPVYTNQYATVTVKGGTGSGTYPTGSDVTITANEVAGKEFSHWTFSYYANVKDTKVTTIEVKGSPYTFKMGTDVALKAVTATANYTQLYSLTLQNAQASAAGDLRMTRPATTVSPIIPEKIVSSAAGETSIAAYWKSGDVITIQTPAKVTVEGTEYTFTNWRIISGKGTLASATSAETTFTMTTANTVLAAQYGGNMLIYKTEERDSVHLYDNWSYASYAEGDLVQLTAANPDKSFVRWACEPADLIRDAEKGNLTITFNMPAGTAKVWPEYAHTITLTDGEYSLDGGTTWTLGGGTAVRVSTGDTVRIRPIEDKVGSNTTGKKLFKSWRANTTRIAGATAEQSFTMPPEDLELSVVYQTYTLTVYRTVDGTEETYDLYPGEYITLTSEEASGGRCFNYWTHTSGLTFTVVDEKFDTKDSNRLVSQRITVQMPASNAFIHAWYELYPRYDYWNTDAFIRVEGEPKRYYARLEYFQAWDMKVIYYAGLSGAGVEVDPKDYVMQIVKAGTNEVATTSDFCFTQEGAFDIIVTMIVEGRQMAPAIRVMDQPSTHLYCIATRPEFVQTFTKPARTVYYEGEEVEKDGLDVLLRSADHTGGAIRYSTVRELDESEYKLKPWGTGWDADGYTNMALPTQEKIQEKIDAGKFGYKLENGRYYVCMEVTDCFDYTQYNSDGSYMRMEYIVNDATDYVWVEVCKPVTNITLEAIKGDNTKDVVNNVASTTYPFVSWEISDDLATAQSGIRKLKVNADGYTDVKALAAAMEYVNSDPNVAYLEATTDPLVYNVKIKSEGVTTITFRALGDSSVYATCEITVKTSTAVQKMTSLTSLNKSAVNLYVGTKLTLYPVTYEPTNANTACNWYVSFSDNLLPQNAEYYVSVNEAGVVEVLKYTDRPVRIWACPVYDPGDNTFNSATNTATGLHACCDITVLQIPVDNMTLYPAAMTMYRLATRSLKATVYPEAASDKTIRWTSSDSSVASVDNDGNVTANKLGTATITATSEINTKVYQTCKVTVQESVLLTGLTLNKTSATLGIEDTLVLTPYFTPATATTKSVTWASNATTVATVDSNGKVRGLSEGVAVITATATDGTGKQASCVVSVSTIVASAVVLNKQTLALIEDETETLTATVYPTNASNGKVNWTSSNVNVATVDPDGVVTAVGGGSAVITATAKDASTKYADCVVAVTAKIPVTAITLNLGNFDMLLNDTTVLAPTIAPANATYKVTWTSSDASVASVDEKGKVSALKTGAAIITCKAGDMTKAITVSVVTKTYSTGKVVNCARRVNVRANSSGASTIVGFAYLGDVYKVLDKTSNWYKIQYNATTTAYIWHRYLSATETGAGYVSAGKVGSTTDTTTGTTTTPAPTVTAKTLTITNCTYCVNVRSGAGTSFSRLGYAYLDEAFTYTGTQGDWYIITYNGATAYVSSQFVKVN